MTRRLCRTATCRFCGRSRPVRLLTLAPDGEHYQCRDEIDCSEATQWSSGGDGR